MAGDLRVTFGRSAEHSVTVRHLLPAALPMQAAALSRLAATLTVAAGDSKVKLVTCHTVVTRHQCMACEHGVLWSALHGWALHVHACLHVLP